MTREMTWMGLLATLLIAAVMGVNVLREDDRQADAEIEMRIDAVIDGMDLFAENCAVCHGASGEGLGATPPLNLDAVREMDYETISHTIERGRYNTKMAAYGVEEGGILTNAQIDNVVAVIQYANWNAVAARVDELGLTPPDVVVVELTDDLLQTVGDLPGGETLVAGLEVFAAECAACHGGNAEGSTIAPALDSAELRARMADADLQRTIENGVPGTLMAAWDGALTNEQIANVTQLVRRWEDLTNAGIELPVIEAEPIDMSPEAIANGEWLFNLMCTQCHGAGGYGSPMAPALNNQQFLNDTPDPAIQQIISLGVPGTIMPAWGGRLTETDIATIVAYLRSLEPTAPTIVQPAGDAATTPSTTLGGGPPWQRN